VGGGGCVDVDECARAQDHDCGENAVCENRTGSFACRCKSGFGLENGVCKSLDLCVGVANTCHPSAACSLKDGGGIACSCAANFEGNGLQCVDVNECESGAANCIANAHCVNTRDSFTCACDTLFTGDGQVQCRDRCEAAQSDTSRCDPGGHGQCIVQPDGEATCTSCSSGFLGDGKRCTSDAACGALTCGKNSVCGGAAGARECACAPGFDGDAAQGCEDVNECANGSADCNPDTSRCLNVPGSYVCECKPGFARDGSECIDVDECVLDTHRCDPNAECANKVGGYACECKKGYENQPDGLSCADIDECGNGSATCRKDDKSVVCANTRGGYECKCPSGYAGDGTNEACYCDLSGYWAVRQDALLIFPERAAAGQVLVAKSVTYASIWELHKLSYDGSKISVQKKACGSDVAPEIYSPLYDETYSSVTPNMVFDKLPLFASTDIPLNKSSALPGNTFMTPRAANVQGVKLDDPLNSPWPKSFMDIPSDRWVDSEDDGEPGISLWPGSTNKVALTGMGDTYSYLPVALQEGSTIIERRLGCASVALRSIGAMRVNIDSCDLLTGSLQEAHVEGRVHSCTVLRKDDWDKTEVSCARKDWSDARRCSKEEVQFLDEQDQTNMISATFEMQKLSGLDAEKDCAAVRAKLPAIVRNK
jgi:Calcium-binding EGF domain/EGF domain